MVVWELAQQDLKQKGSVVERFAVVGSGRELRPI